MALDINGYNSVFKQFVQFAQENRNVDKGRTILDAKIESPLGGRKILSIDRASVSVERRHFYTKWRFYASEFYT